MTRTSALSVALHGGLFAIVVACSVDVPIGSNARSNVMAKPDAGSRAPDAGLVADAAEAAHVCHTAPCEGHIYACGDCVDNDGDGKIDMDDPDCLGPCQNAEDSFFGAIPGQNHMPCTEDCYFDQDSGFGNDDCIWSHQCDPLTPDATCAYDPTVKLPKSADCGTAQSTQSTECASVCGPLTPNGCDCFGCCAFPEAATPVWLGSVDDEGNPTCDLAHVADPTRCKPCTQVEACLNPCDACELCAGKTVLPPSCSTGKACPSPVCDGRTPCGTPCLPDCPSGQACITGCCVDQLR